jgi:hypothetical protein
MTRGSVRRHRRAILEFHNAYVAYLEHGPGGDQALRSRVVALTPGGQAAMVAAGIHPILYPPPAFGGPIRHGLANIMFDHEGRRMGGDETVRGVLDWCRLTDAQLEQHEDEILRQRRNPLHWIDRAIRGVLGVPAYLISVIFRTSFDRIDGSSFGVVLRLISAVGTFFAVYFGGVQVGWW